MADAWLLESLNTRYAIGVEEVIHLRDGGCASYTARGAYDKYLIKLVSPAFADTALRSVDILLHLEGAGFPSPRLVRTLTGAASTEENGRMVLVFHFIEGREPEEGERLADVGTLVGELHEAMEGYKGPLAPRGKHFFVGRYLAQLEQKGYPEGKLSVFREMGDALWARVTNLPRGFCHGDLHRGNLLFSPDGRIHLLDFDTACEAFPMYDAMVMCDATDYFTFRPEGYDAALDALSAFLTGYRRRRTLSDREVSAFPDLIAIRHFQLQATILEIYGLTCVDEAFIDRQLDWLTRWMDQCAHKSACAMI